jgi:hypothetical protein
MEKTRIVDQIRTEYVSIILRDRNRWDEATIALALLAKAETLIRNLQATDDE